MNTAIVKVYRVSTMDEWPYERVLEVLVQPVKAPIALAATFTWRNPECDAGFRMYTVHPGEYVEWSLVEAHESREEFSNCNDISPEQMHLANVTPWLQVDHILFSSNKGKDRAKLRKLHEFVQKKGTQGLDVAAGLPPLKLELRYPDSPRWEWYGNADFSEMARSSLFISPLKSDGIPQINYNTIPKGYEYEFVTALITHYYQPKSLPTYAALLEQQNKYAKWFHSVNG